MRLLIALLTLGLIIGQAAPAAGAYKTPPSKVVEAYEPSYSEFGNGTGRARAVIAHNTYNTPILRQQVIKTNTPSVTYLTFKGDVANPVGIWLHVSHGVTDSKTRISYLSVEAFKGDSTGLVAARNKMTSYVNGGTISAGDIAIWPENNYYAWVLGITANGISQYRTSSGALVYAASCDSWKTRSGWGADAFAGYDYAVTDPTADSEEGTFWNHLDGDQGRTNRTVSAAASGTTMLVDPAISDMVIAPAISDWTYGDGFTNGTITFDTVMDSNVDPYSVLTPSGAIQLTSQYWTGDTQLEYCPVCNYDGNGSVTLATNSVVTASGIALNPDGIGGRTETFKVGYACNGGINPASNVDNFMAINDGSGVMIRWTTDWERNTVGFQVTRISPDGTATPLAAVTAQGSGQYEVQDATGSANDVYHLVEHQTNGRRDLSYGYRAVQPAFTPVNTPLQIDSVFVDSVLATVPNHVFTEATETPDAIWRTTVVIVTPEYLLPSAQAMDDVLWNNGISSNIVRYPTDTNTYGGIKGFLDHAHDGWGRYAILWGPACDSTQLHTPWLPKYPGFPFPTFPLRHTPNALPSNYVWVPQDSAYKSLSWFEPFYSSDMFYVDFDTDSLPDMALGRIPVQTNAEGNAYAAKNQQYRTTPSGTPWTTRAWLSSYAVNNGTVPGDFVATSAAALATHVPSSFTLIQHINRNGPTWNTFQSDSIETSVMNPGIGLRVITNSLSNRYNDGFSAKQLGGSPAHWTANHAYPVTVSASCDLDDFDRTLDDRYGYPFGHDAMFLPDRGYVASFGPTRGTWQKGNEYIAAHFLDDIGRGLDFGTAGMMSQRSIIVGHPEYRDLAYSYVLLGDPTLHLIGTTAITGVGDAPAAPRIGLGRPSPNPFNPSTSLTIYLAAQSKVHLAIYDVHGRLVRTLADKRLPSGPTTLRWNGQDDSGRPTASGVYFARLSAPYAHSVQKLVHLK